MKIRIKLILASVSWDPVELLVTDVESSAIITIIEVVQISTMALKRLAINLPLKTLHLTSSRSQGSVSTQIDQKTKQARERHLHPQSTTAVAKIVYQNSLDLLISANEWSKSVNATKVGMKVHFKMQRATRSKIGFCLISKISMRQWLMESVG